MTDYPTTDNHDFARPEPGTLGDEWGTVINEDLIDLLERRVPVRDTEENRSNYTPHEDVPFIATDTGAVYDGDDGEWIEATREVERLRTAAEPAYNVKAYGAAGDGTTDDTQAIQDAIDAAAGEGGDVSLPPGTYRITGGLRVDAGSVVGAGLSRTVLDVDDVVSTALKFGELAEGDGVARLGIECNGNARTGVRMGQDFGYAHRVAVHDVTDEHAGRTTSGIWVSGGDCTVADCRAVGAHAPVAGVSRGIRVENAPRALVHGCFVDDVTPKADGDGIVVQGTSHGSRVIGCHVEHADKSALKINAPGGDDHIEVVAAGNTLSADNDCLCVARIEGTRTTFTGNTLVNESVGDAVLRVVTNPGEEPQPVTVTGNVIQLTDHQRYDDLIRVRHTDRNVTISDNVLRDGENGIWVDDSESVIVSNNNIEGVDNLGIFFNGTRRGVINGNLVNSDGAEGYYINDGTNGVNIVGNTIDTPGGTFVHEDATNIEETGNLVL